MVEIFFQAYHHHQSNRLLQFCNNRRNWPTLDFYLFIVSHSFYLSSLSVLLLFVSSSLHFSYLSSLSLFLFSFFFRFFPTQFNFFNSLSLSPSLSFSLWPKLISLFYYFFLFSHTIISFFPTILWISSLFLFLSHSVLLLTFQIPKINFEPVIFFHLQTLVSGKRVISHEVFLSEHHLLSHRHQIVFY